MITFAEKGKVNTAQAQKIAIECAKERGLDIVCATTGGESALSILQLSEELGYRGKITIVTHVYSYEHQNDMPEDIREQVSAKAYRVVTAAHALSAGERGISAMFKGNYPLEIIAQTLRMFSNGVKVCVEIALMAVDNGAITAGRPVVCVGGSSHGSDTVCIVSPAPSADLYKTKINEILCKPGYYQQ